jgi:acetyl esterase/lipase
MAALLGFGVFLLLAAGDPIEADRLRVPLWAAGAPMAQGDGAAHQPALAVYLPGAKATGAAVVILPGGGYAGLAMDHEGVQVARWLNENGIAGFILNYRHAPQYRHPVPLMDAQRAVRTVRARAVEFGVDPARIGMIGFSAGGHLTATAATKFDAGDPAAADPVERVSCRPDFVMLGYPVITMTDPYTHAGSRKNLLGENPSQEMIDLLSAEKQVTKETPPVFLVHTTEDQAVPLQNPLMFYEACAAAGVPCEIHIYERGRHGLGLGGGDAAFAQWPGQCMQWLRVRGVIP